MQGQPAEDGNLAQDFAVFYWALVKGFHLRCRNKEAVLFTIGPCYVNLTEIPSQEPSLCSILYGHVLYCTSVTDQAYSSSWLTYTYTYMRARRIQ